MKTSDENCERLVRLFQELLNALPPGTASLDAKRTEKGDGTIVLLKPTKKDAAQFCAHVEDGNSSIIDVSFGSSTTFELPAESKLPDDANFDMMLEAVRAMGLATISGRCREYFGFMGIRGTIEVSEGNVLSCSNLFHPRLLPKMKRYQPYV
jgi:hypothetical protein